LSISCTDPSPSPFSTLSLHDALPISVLVRVVVQVLVGFPLSRTANDAGRGEDADGPAQRRGCCHGCGDRFNGLLHPANRDEQERSEEHTSELQSPYDLVCRLLLEKKK